MNSYIGIDVHKDSCYASVQDEGREIVEQGYFQNSPSGFERFLMGIVDAEVAIEAGDT